jgi:hypothetical protein
MNGKSRGALPAIRAIYAPTRRTTWRLVQCEIDSDPWVPIELDQRLPRKLTTEYVCKCLSAAGAGAPKTKTSLDWLAFELELVRRQARVALAVKAKLDDCRKDRERIVNAHRNLAREIERGMHDGAAEVYFNADLQATRVAFDAVPVPAPVLRPETPWHRAALCVYAAFTYKFGAARPHWDNPSVRFTQSALGVMGLGSYELPAIEKVIRDHLREVQETGHRRPPKWFTLGSREILLKGEDLADDGLGQV